MIEYIKGEIVELNPAQMIMDCNGIGYTINISLTTYSAFKGFREGKIFVYEVIREDAHLLFGFATHEERELFLLLITVSGVGPNTARMILSSLPPADLIDIIATGDDVSLTAVKGIGNKTAQRIVVDLRNKVKPLTAFGAENRQRVQDDRSDVAQGAVAALLMLGFQKAASQKAVTSILKKSPDAVVEQVIKDALKIL
jgi:Holliday junction DNA helicase RuvA